MATSTLNNRYKTISGTLTTTANGNRSIGLYLPYKVVTAICTNPSGTAVVIPYLLENNQWALHFMSVTTQAALANTEVAYEVTYI